MLEKIENWIIKVWDKVKVWNKVKDKKLKTLLYNIFAKLILADIFTTIPSLMLSEYNTVSVQFINTRKNEFIISSFCNIYSNNHNSEFQKERNNKEEYAWSLNCKIDKNNFGNSFQQLVTVRSILKNLTKEETHYSQDEISILMINARRLDKENTEKKM